MGVQVKRSRVLKLEAGNNANTRRFLSSMPSDVSAGAQRRVTIVRTGTFTDPRYGKFDVTKAMLLSMVRNFQNSVYGQEIFIDVAHRPNDGAAAKVLALMVEGDRLRADVEFTAFGVSAVKDRGMVYLSAEFAEDFVDNEGGKHHGPTLLGAALTVRPVIKRLDPIQLSENEHAVPVYLHPALVRQLNEVLEQNMNKYLQALLARIAAAGFKLSEDNIQTITLAYMASIKTLSEDDTAGYSAIDAQFENLAKQLSKMPDGAAVNLQVATGVSAEDVRKILAEDAKARAEQVKKLSDDRQAHVAAFVKILEEAKGLDDATRKTLAQAEDLITADMSADQVKRLAELQVTQGVALMAARQLAAMGYEVRGNAHITVDESNSIRKLCEDIRTGLKSSSGAAKMAFVPDEKLTPFAHKVLSEFDKNNAGALQNEAKMLAGGPVVVGDAYLPASHQREVIREALSDLKILDFINTNVDATASPVHVVPIETRDTSAIRNGGIVYEGQPIPAAGVGTTFESAYIEPTKLSMNLTNEALFFTANNRVINFDAWARTVASNSRVMRELLTVRIANRMQREGASFGAVFVPTTTLTEASLSPGTYKVNGNNFPIVRERRVRDLTGTQIGATQEAISVFQDGDICYEWSPGVAAGLYHRVVNYNLGFIQLVNELGVPQESLPDVTARFWRETNVEKFDLDFVAPVTNDIHLNGLLETVGRRNAILAQDRFVVPDFSLMSYTLNNIAASAQNFTAAGSRGDANISSAGLMQTIKGLPAIGSNQPGIDVGSERILIATRDALTYTVSKPFSFGAPFEAFDVATGRPTGKRIAYGEEYSSVHVSERHRGHITAVLAYSLAARNAA